MAGIWVLVLADPGAFGILIGLGMRNGEALFTGDVMITGQSVRLRQTWHRRREFSVEIKNKRYSDGYWQRWDRALLERLTQAN